MQEVIQSVFEVLLTIEIGLSITLAVWLMWKHGVRLTDLPEEMTKAYEAFKAMFRQRD